MATRDYQKVDRVYWNVDARSDWVESSIYRQSYSTLENAVESAGGWSMDVCSRVETEIVHKPTGDVVWSKVYTG